MSKNIYLNRLGMGDREVWYGEPDGRVRACLSSDDQSIILVELGPAESNETDARSKIFPYSHKVREMLLLYHVLDNSLEDAFKTHQCTTTCTGSCRKLKSYKPHLHA